MTSVPVFPIPLASNTVYAVPTRDGAVLIDAGPDYEGAWEALAAGLAAHGLAPADVRLVCLTHGHADHAGLGRRWQEAGAQVVAGAGDAFALGQPPEGLAAYRANVLACLAAHGVPPEPLEALRRHWRRAAAPRDDEEADAARRPAAARWPGPLRVTPFAPDRLVTGREEIAAGGVTLLAVPCPGHTPGTVVYLLPEQGAAFTGDHLLPGVTPAPGLQFLENRPDRRFRALPAFRRSLAWLAEAAPAVAYPGHGGPVADPAEAARRTLRRQEARAARVLRALGEGPATAFELARRFFPRLPARYLAPALAEIIGVLDWLEEEGRIRPLPGEGAVRYRLAGG